MVRLVFDVALLAEGVDRNFFVPNRLLWEHWSPSSRRAWIEIRNTALSWVWQLVALLAEGVDRNISCCWIVCSFAGRPPRGGRG